MHIRTHRDHGSMHKAAETQARWGSQSRDENWTQAPIRAKVALSVKYCAYEIIHETKTPLISKLLAQAQIIPDMLLFMGDNKPRVFTPLNKFV